MTVNKLTCAELDRILIRVGLLLADPRQTIREPYLG